jgi:hypothetical protein
LKIAERLGADKKDPKQMKVVAARQTAGLAQRPLPLNAGGLVPLGKSTVATVQDRTGELK